jgi:hypothetical protein
MGRAREKECAAPLAAGVIFQGQHRHPDTAIIRCAQAHECAAALCTSQDRRLQFPVGCDAPGAYAPRRGNRHGVAHGQLTTRGTIRAHEARVERDDCRGIGKFIEKGGAPAVARASLRGHTGGVLRLDPNHRFHGLLLHRTP